VRQVLSPCAVGSLRPDYGPGTIVVPDQVVDRTSGRAHTIYETEGPVVHVGFADPYCPNGRQVAVDAARLSELQVVPDGTLVVINGPRFSSRAESLMHQAAGFGIVGMTTMPEAALARELAMCFTTIAMVTDHDAGVEGGDAVTHQEVLEVFARNIDGLKQVLRSALAALPETEPDPEATCACRRALDGITLPFELPG
jgi:5'-methylthioadenosine phosphorylase